MHLRTLIPVVLFALVACGKDKGGGGGAAAGGPSCADAAAGYVRHDSESGGNEIYSLKPTADEAKAIAAKLEADCTARNWSEKIKTCLVAPGQRKFGENCGTDINASQVVFDAVKAIEAARAAAGPAAGSGSAAAGSGSAAAGSGSAAAGSDSGSAAAGSAAAGSGSAADGSGSAAAGSAAGSAK